MSSISTLNSSPSVSVFPSSTSGSPSADASGQVQNTLSAVNVVQQIPGQLKAQAHNWATQELSHLLDVLRVTLADDPSSGAALKQLAQGISSDAKQVGGQNGSNSATNPVASLVAASQSGGTTQGGTQIDISVSETITQTEISTDNTSSNGDNVYFSSQSESDDVEIEVDTLSGNPQSSPEQYAHDVTLLSQASVAIGQINETLKEAIKNSGCR